MRVSVGSIGVCLVAFATFLGGCATAPKTEKGREDLSEAVRSTQKRLNVQDPSLSDFLSHAHGYAIFPVVGKGGFIVGGSYGRGHVYEAGNMIGYADITQGTVGLQAGGQTFTEVLAFEDERALQRFKEGKFAFAANASAVALKSGAAATAKYSDGVAVFIDPQGGLMVEAAIGGQSFTYQPK